MDEQYLERMDSQLAGWVEPMARLRQALDNNEFALFYQPILALQGRGGYPMAEVLVRLREEERALLPPGEFLPVFEHYHMMPELDRWVVRNVVKCLARGSRIPRFSINVSGQTLDDPQFPRFVAGELMSAGVPARSVLFEIDESDTQVRLEAATRFAAAMKSIGGGLVIDGFCRRTVSFTPLKALRADYVKVDGSVIRTLLTSTVASTKMNAILRIAEAIGLEVVAECVEEQDILTRLKALGVGYAQGFGIFEPHSIDSLLA